MIHIQATQNAKAAFGNAEYGLVSVEFLHLRALCGAKPRFSGPFSGTTYLKVGPLPGGHPAKWASFSIQIFEKGRNFQGNAVIEYDAKALGAARDLPSHLGIY